MSITLQKVFWAATVLCTESSSSGLRRQVYPTPGASAECLAKDQVWEKRMRCNVASDIIKWRFIYQERTSIKNLFNHWRCRGLNPGPFTCKANALPLRYIPFCFYEWKILRKVFVDTKIFTLGKRSCMGVNRSMPDIDAVSPKIDRRGIKIVHPGKVDLVGRMNLGHKLSEIFKKKDLLTLDNPGLNPGPGPYIHF